MQAVSSGSTWTNDTGSAGRNCRLARTALADFSAARPVQSLPVVSDGLYRFTPQNLLPYLCALLAAGPNLSEGRAVNAVKPFRVASRTIIISIWAILQPCGSVFAHDDRPPRGIAVDLQGSLRTTKLRINWVLGIDNGHVETDVSGVLKCGDPAMLRDLEFYASHQAPASVAFDEVTRQISAIASAPVDLLLAVSDTDPDAPWISVQLLKRPTLLRLSRSNARFSELLTLLRDAAKRQVPVAIGLWPADNDIQDVRVDVPHP